MKIRKYNSHLNKGKYSGETFDSPSLTIPNQSLSITTIIERHTRGQHIPQSRQAIFRNPEDHDGFPEFEKMDTIQRAEALVEVKNIQTELKQTIEGRELTIKEGREKLKKEKEAAKQAIELKKVLVKESPAETE